MSEILPRGDLGKMLKKETDEWGFKNTQAQMASSPNLYALEVQT